MIELVTWGADTERDRQALDAFKTQRRSENNDDLLRNMELKVVIVTRGCSPNFKGSRWATERRTPR